MWATWLEEKSSHCRTLKTVSCEGTGKAWHSSADPSPKQTLAYKYWIILSNPQFIFLHRIKFVLSYTMLYIRWRCRTLSLSFILPWTAEQKAARQSKPILPRYTEQALWYTPARSWSSVCIWMIKHQICSIRISTASFKQLLRPSWRTMTPVWWILGKKKCDSVRYLSGTRPTLVALMRRWVWILFGCFIQDNKLILFVASSHQCPPSFFAVADVDCGAHGWFSEEDQPAGGHFRWED